MLKNKIFMGTYFETINTKRLQILGYTYKYNESIMNFQLDLLIMIPTYDQKGLHPNEQIL